MDKIINFQMSLFGSFINVQPNLQLTNRIEANLRDDDFVPSIAVVSEFDPEKKQVITENRLQMTSKDHSWSIVFLADRIDINYFYPGGEQFFSNLHDILELSKKYCSHTFASIADTTGNRIAINGKFLLKEMSFDEKQKIISEFTIIPKIFENNPVTEWSVHYNSPKTIKFGNKLEKCNNILDINEIVGINSKEQTISKRMVIGLDINTDQANKILKYKFTDLLELANVVEDMMLATLMEIEGHIS